MNEEKIRSKAIKSVSSRVTNIKSYLPSTYTLNCLIDQIKNHVLANYNAAEFEMPIKEQIKQIALRNASSDWLYPKRSYLSDYTVKNEKRYDFGTVSLVIKKTNEIITDIDISGDFFGTKDIKILEEKLKNLNTKSIEKVLLSLNLSDYIMGMSNAEFIALLAK